MPPASCGADPGVGRPFEALHRGGLIFLVQAIVQRATGCDVVLSSLLQMLCVALQAELEPEYLA